MNFAVTLIEYDYIVKFITKGKNYGKNKIKRGGESRNYNTC